ncbi:glycoside hydrolase family 43 protein [Foetidibacter luteolus]|uniref:glycoside hydrolase family 43 protein n=1 Tax=Foetidibacter luteolus TaxID=2608880 RepID=UPI00129B7312|nr:glycoside hydrolase family 43 protein [Foetidibacter luteolus]
MKKIFLSFVLCCVACYGYGQRQDSALLFSYFINNGEDGLHFAWSKDGYSWQALKGGSSFLTPTAGVDKLMRDPCIIRGGDGLFHMVWTVSWNEKSIGYASSKDLVNWSPQQDIPVMAHENDALNCWAPEIFYDAANSEYMIYWATTIPGRFPESDTAGDSKYNHRMYYVTTKDFKTFSRAAVLYDKGFNVIDASIHKEGQRYIMFLKNETLKPVPEKNIRMATSTQLTAGYGQASKPITGNYWAEGPTAVKWQGKWIVYFDKYTQHAYGAVTSTDLLHWQDESDKVSFPKGLRHGTVLKVSFAELQKLMQ